MGAGSNEVDLCTFWECDEEADLRTVDEDTSDWKRQFREALPQLPVRVQAAPLPEWSPKFDYIGEMVDEIVDNEMESKIEEAIQKKIPSDSLSCGSNRTVGSSICSEKLDVAVDGKSCSVGGVVMAVDDRSREPDPSTYEVKTVTTNDYEADVPETLTSPIGKQGLELQQPWCPLLGSCGDACKTPYPFHKGQHGTKSEQNRAGADHSQADPGSSNVISPSSGDDFPPRAIPCTTLRRRRCGVPVFL